MGSYKVSELAVITKTKELCEYVLHVTEKSPKRFRFTITAKLHNYALDAVEHLYRANAIYIVNNNKAKMVNRLDLQYQAMTDLRMLGYMAEVAKNQQCILPKQFENVSKMVYECRNLITAWSESDKKRFERYRNQGQQMQLPLG